MKKPKKEVRYGADIGYTGNFGRSHRNQVFNLSCRGRNLSTDGIFRTEEGVKGSFFFFVKKGEVIVSDLDILVREMYGIPEDEDTVDWCDEHGVNYKDAIRQVYMKGRKT